MTVMDPGKILRRLNQIARIMHDKPRIALKELQDVSSLIDSLVPYYDGHTQRVNEYSLKIGKHLSLDDKDMVILEAAALLHDLGKIGIDEGIFLKHDQLTEVEKIEIEMHVLRGYYMLSGFAELDEILNGVKSHHEHHDGAGYPERLSKNNIPLIGRIIAVADAYDAMTSARPYRKARSKHEALKELKRCSGRQFDPKIVEVFTKIIDEDK